MLGLVLYVIGSACLCFVLHAAIQEGQILGAWQKVLTKLYAKHDNWEKFLGGCYMCFSHFIAILTFIPYAIFNLSGWWLFLYLLYVPTVIVCSLYIKKKLE